MALFECKKVSSVLPCLKHKCQISLAFSWIYFSTFWRQSVYFFVTKYFLFSDFFAHQKHREQQLSGPKITANKALFECKSEVSVFTRIFFARKQKDQFLLANYCEFRKQLFSSVWISATNSRVEFYTVCWIYFSTFWSVFFVTKYFYFQIFGSPET